jgi:hypothetical protein
MRLSSGTEAVLVFATWWGWWSVLDCVLLKYSPWPQIAALVVTTSAWACLRCRARCAPEAEHKSNSSLTREALEREDIQNLKVSNV